MTTSWGRGPRCRWQVATSLVALLGIAVALPTGGGPVAAQPSIPAGWMVRVNVEEAIGGKTVIGQLTVDRANQPGFITAYACNEGIPTKGSEISRSDLNYNGHVTPVASNRLIVQADTNGDICFHASTNVDLIVDVNAVSFDVGINSFPNRRTDTRTSSAPPHVRAGGILQVNVPEAAGAKTVIGQLTVDRANQPGFITAYACNEGIPTKGSEISRSDLNYNGHVTPVASNRLIVQADTNGDICFHASTNVDLIVDVNGVTDVGINSFPNRRTDTRTSTTTIAPPGNGSIPEWPGYAPVPALPGVAALTGESASPTIAARPIVAVKIDNYRAARPHWGLDRADAVIELNVEGVSRFVALFQTELPNAVGPVRSARTADLDLLAAMNRPVFAYSGANPGVTDWIRSATLSGVTVDFNALHRPCYRRTPERPGPHNLLLDATCAVEVATAPGPARPLWSIDATWNPAPGSTTKPDSTFTVPMDGVSVNWTWEPTSGRYLRSQDGQPHVTASGVRISARTVVELRTRYIPSPVDARSPHAVTVGSGEATIHRNGRAIMATWSRPTAYDSFIFTAVDGHAVPLDRGRTYLEISRTP